MGDVLEWIHITPLILHIGKIDVNSELELYSSLDALVLLPVLIDVEVKYTVLIEIEGSDSGEIESIHRLVDALAFTPSHKVIHSPGSLLRELDIALPADFADDSGIRSGNI